MTQLDLSNLSIDELNILMEQRKQEIEQERVEHIKQTYLKQQTKYNRFMNKENNQERNIGFYLKRIPSTRGRYQDAVKSIKHVWSYDTKDAVSDVEQFVQQTEYIMNVVKEMKSIYESQSQEWKDKMERVLEEDAWEKEKARFLKEDMK